MRQTRHANRELLRRHGVWSLSKERTTAMKKILAMSVFVLGLTVGGFAKDAEACGGAIMLEQIEAPTPVQMVSGAEKMIERGQNAQAARQITDTFPAIRGAHAGQDPLKTRAMRVLALALVRSEGTAIKSGGWTANANLAWSVEALREIDQKRANDPSVQADLGEALSKTPAGKAEALRMLGKLADKDLMGSPHAYSALAKLRAEKGDTEGSALAVKRCEEMAKDASVCKEKKPVAAAAVPAKTGPVAVRQPSRGDELAFGAF